MEIAEESIMDDPAIDAIFTNTATVVLDQTDAVPGNNADLAISTAAPRRMSAGPSRRSPT